MLAALLARLGLPRFGAGQLLGALGVAVGVGNIIGLISVTESGRWQSLGMLRDAGADTVFVLPFAGGDSPDQARGAASATLPEGSLEWVREVPEVDSAVGILIMPGHAGFGAQREFTVIQGVTPEYLDVRGHRVARGRFFSASDEAGEAEVCTLGCDIAPKLFGKAEPLGQRIVVKGRKLEVIGVMAQKGLIGFENMDDRVFVPLSTAQDMYSLHGLHSILARSRDKSGAARAADAIEDHLRSRLGLNPGVPADFSTQTVDELTGVIDEMLKVFRYLLYGISSVALLVAGIGIMNVMLMQVLERTREIGVRRAVGARRSVVLRQFLLEAVWQCIAGAIVGGLIGSAGSALFCVLVDWQPYITLRTIAVAIGFSTAVGVVFGLYPAAKAAGLKPIDCLRYE